MMPKLCLGTAQFGMAYGITNHSGQVAEREVKAMLEQAACAGIQMLDTAQAYGDAEAVLGRTLPKEHSFRIISKLPAQNQRSFSEDDPPIWEEDFKSSCERIGVTHLDGLLLHNPVDLAKPGSEHLHFWLLSLRDRGLVKRLGVSIYEAQDLEGLPRELLDLVQLPLSLYDQRLLLNGTVSRLRSQGIAIHARSLYLQGLLLISANRWPRWVDPVLRNHHHRLEAIAVQLGCRLLDFAISFARDQSDLEGVVFGLCSRRELQELLASWTGINPWRNGEWRTWHLSDSTILYPRRWPN